MQETAELLGKGLNREISGSVSRSTSDGKRVMKRKEPPKQYKVHSLERGLDLIELMTEGSPEKSLTELSQLAGFNMTTTHRILDALKSRGYVQQNLATSEYKLSLKLFELGNQVMRHVNLREEALPILKTLANTTGETAYLIILDGDEALCLERIDGHHYVKVLFLQIGDRMPLHIGAGPRVLLAHLPGTEINRIIKTKSLTRWTPRSITNSAVLRARSPRNSES